MIDVDSEDRLPSVYTMNSKAKLVFMPSGKRGEFPIGTSLLDAGRALGVDLDTVCGGRAVCGRCQIEPSFF